MAGILKGAGVSTFVVDLAGGLDEVLEMGAGEEVAEIDEFAMPLVLDVDGTPAVLSCRHILTIARSAAARCYEPH